MKFVFQKEYAKTQKLIMRFSPIWQEKQQNEVQLET